MTGLEGRSVLTRGIQTTLRQHARLKLARTEPGITVRPLQRWKSGS